jgi:hypothetical protein
MLSLCGSKTLRRTAKEQFFDDTIACLNALIARVADLLDH